MCNIYNMYTHTHIHVYLYTNTPVISQRTSIQAYNEGAPDGGPGKTSIFPA